MHRSKYSSGQTDFIDSLMSTPLEHEHVQHEFTQQGVEPVKTARQLVMDVNTPQRFNFEVAGGVYLNKLKDFSLGNLENIFCGLHNLYLPGDVLLRINPAEALAAYFTAGKEKLRIYHAWNSETLESLRQGNDRVREMDYRENRYSSLLSDAGYSSEDISDLFKKFNEVAFTDSNFRYVSGKMNNLFKGSMIERLSDVSSEASGKLIGSFFKPYIPSNKQESRHPQSFYDPNIDGSDKHAYATKIYKSFKEYYSGQRVGNSIRNDSNAGSRGSR